MDNAGKQIAEILEATPQSAVMKLNEYAPSLQSYGKLKIKGTDEKGIGNNYAHAKEWTVFFESTTPVLNGGGSWMNAGAMQQGGMNNELIKALVGLETIKLQFDYFKKEQSLEEKHKKKDDFNPAKYLPLAGPMLGANILQG